MRKNVLGGLFLGVAGLVMALGTAHAEGVSVSIDDANGATVISAPGLPDGVAYPDAIDTQITGKASFDNADNGVTVQLIQGSGDAAVVAYTRQADLTCDEANSCTWSFTVPFIITPGDYTVLATAGEAAAEEGGDPITATAQIAVTIL